MSIAFSLRRLLACSSYVFVFLLLLSQAFSATASRIAWIFGPQHFSENMTRNDALFVQSLEADGHTVVRFDGTMTPSSTPPFFDEEQSEELNTYDLVIISRITWSNAFRETDAYDLLTVPLILCNPYIYSLTGSQWSSAATYRTSNSLPLVAINASHPVLVGVSLDAANAVEVLGGASVDFPLVNDNDFGSATVIATAESSDTLFPFVVYYPADEPYFSLASVSPAAPRLFMPLPECTQGPCFFNSEGEKVWRNAVNFMHKGSIIASIPNGLPKVNLVPSGTGLDSATVRLSLNRHTQRDITFAIASLPAFLDASPAIGQSITITPSTQYVDITLQTRPGFAAGEEGDVTFTVADSGDPSFVGVVPLPLPVKIITTASLSLSAAELDVSAGGVGGATFAIEASVEAEYNVSFTFSVGSDIQIDGGNTVTMVAGSSSVDVTVRGSSDSLPGTSSVVSLGAVSSLDAAFHGQTLSQTVVVTIIEAGTISAAPSALRVPVQGGASQTLTLTLSQPPRQRVTVPVTVPPQIVLNVGNAVVFESDVSSVDVVVSGAGSETIDNASLLFGRSSSSDVRFEGVQPLPERVQVEVVAMGVLSLPSSMLVAVSEGTATTINITANPPPISSVTFALTLPSSLTLLSPSAPSLPQPF